MMDRILTWDRVGLTFFFSSNRRHTRFDCDWSSDVCSSDLPATLLIALGGFVPSVTSGLTRFGVTWAFALGQLLGVLLILAGFMVSEEVLRPLPAAAAPTAATAGVTGGVAWATLSGEPSEEGEGR